MSEPIRISESEPVGDDATEGLCKRCNQAMSTVEPWMEATDYCHNCAQNLVIDLQSELSKMINDYCADDTRIRSLSLTCGVTQDQLDSDPSIIGVVEMIVEQVKNLKCLVQSKVEECNRWDQAWVNQSAKINRLREALERINSETFDPIYMKEIAHASLSKSSS